MFERYTERARRVLFFARYEASQLGSLSIDTEHLLLGLLREGKGLTSRLFARAQLPLDEVRHDIERRSTRREKVSTSVEIPFSVEAKRVLQSAAEEADRLLHAHIGTEHLLLGILRVEGSVAASILAEHGVRFDAVRDDIVGLTGSGGPSDDDGAEHAAVFPRVTAGPPRPRLPDFVPSQGVHIMHSEGPYTPSIRTNDREWVALGFPLTRIIATLWDLPDSRVSVPQALDTAYDVVLRLPAPERRDAIEQRVRAAIEDQLGLSIVREQRPTDVFVMTAPHGPGPALTRQHEDRGGGGAAGAYANLAVAGGESASRIDGFRFFGMPVGVLCGMFEEVLGRPIVDETGLDGTFDIEVTGSAANRAAFITALRDQAGLVFTPARRDIEVLAVSSKS